MGDEQQDAYFMKQLYKFSTTVSLAVLICLGAVTESFAFDCNPQGDQVTYGTNNKWIGYVYQGVTFNQYIGYVHEGIGSNPNFDQNFGGGQVNYNTNGCDVYTDTFSVRYKLTKTFANGYYDITVGGDDGYRLSIDGGNTWIINRWVDQSYTGTTTTVQLNGTYNLVLEFYERFGQNRISFSVGAGCDPSGDPAVSGTTNVWRGYLYQGNNFQTYRGFITEGNSSSPNFNEVFGGSNSNFATSSCGVQTENFSARYRLQMTLPSATYVFTVGGVDRCRFSLDCGNTWVINNRNPQSYTPASYVASLSGAVDMVIEYVEKAGDTRVSFALSSNSSIPVKLPAFIGKSVATDKVQAS